MQISPFTSLQPAFFSQLFLDVSFGDGGFDEEEPVGIGLFATFVGDDLDYLAVSDVMVEWRYFPVDFGAYYAVADFAVDGVGEVDRSGFFGELDDIALWSESEDVIFEEVYLYSLEKFAIVLTDFFLPFLELFDPGKFFGRSCFVSAEEELAPTGASFSFGVCPVGGDAKFGFVVHFLCSDLDFDDASLGTKDGGVE